MSGRSLLETFFVLLFGFLLLTVAQPELQILYRSYNEAIYHINGVVKKDERFAAIVDVRGDVLITRRLLTALCSKSLNKLACLSGSC